MALVLEWIVPMDTLADDFARRRERFVSSFGTNMNDVTQRMQSYAQSNHPWQNRTGDAERLFSVQYTDLLMVIEHGVPYGIHLENMQGGRFGIIPATLTHGKPIIQEAMTRSLAEAYA